MEDDLDQLIEACIEEFNKWDNNKKFSDEFALMKMGNTWLACIGNNANAMVNVGECGGIFEARSDTKKGAVKELIQNVKTGQLA